MAAAGFAAMALSFMIVSVWGVAFLIGGAVLLTTGVVLAAMQAHPYEGLIHERGG